MYSRRVKRTTRPVCPRRLACERRFAPIRARAALGLGFLGVYVDPARNEAGRGDRDISADGAPVAAMVVTAREDLEIARQVRTLIPVG
ncbi:MAG TPA: hypothetical protein VNG13_00715 [Mycobacteriales bacterium]|nr:hypothetical protein [Mycobacteriales bacterium]